MSYGATQEPPSTTQRSSGLVSRLTERLRKLTSLQSRTQSTRQTECGLASAVTYGDKRIGSPRLGFSLNTLPSASRHSRTPPDATSIPYNARMDRRWISPPLLQFGVGALGLSREDNTLDGEGVHNDLADTEEILNSLQPERLSLHHVRLPRHVATDLVSTGNVHRLTDSHSVREGVWDIQPYHTSDPEIDEENARQEQQKLVRHQPHDRLGRYGAGSGSTITDGNTLHRPSPEDALTPEMIFYANLFGIVKDYHEQIDRVVQTSDATGETSKDHFLRENWRYRSAMDRRVLDAECVSGYRVLTNEIDVREAIKRPVGYAIYSSLYQIRDPDAWQRIVKPDSSTVRNGCFTKFTYGMRRALRFMLAMPDDVDLSTESDSQVSCGRNMTDQQEYGTFNADISSPFQSTDGHPLSNSHLLQTTKCSNETRKRSWPCTHTEQCPRISNNHFGMHSLVLLPETMVSPVDSSFSGASSSRGYGQGAFVTILNPYAVRSSKRKSMTMVDTDQLAEMQVSGDEWI